MPPFTWDQTEFQTAHDEIPACFVQSHIEQGRSEKPFNSKQIKDVSPCRPPVDKLVIVGLLTAVRAYLPELQSLSF